MAVPPRQPPAAAPVAQPGTRPAPVVAPPTSKAPTPTPASKPAPAASIPPQGEVENAKGKVLPNPTTRLQLKKQWDEEAVLNSIMRGWHFLGNPINRYNNTAYHWRLFCMPDHDFLSEGDGIVTNINEFYNRIDGYKQVVIAESGVTGYSISDVELTSVFADSSVRGSTSTGISMKISEPNGVSFLDALQTAATEAGIYNYIDFYYYLELTFKGYGEDGKENLQPFANLGQNADGVSQDLPNGGRWLWSVRINNIDVALGSGGGEYKLTLLPMADAALDDEYANTVDTVLARGDTVGDFFDDLQTGLNQSWNRRLALTPNSDGFVTHKFQFHGIPAHGNPPAISEKARARRDAKAADAKLDQPTDGAAAPKPNTEEAEKVILGQELFANGITAEQIRNMPLRPQNQDYSLIRTQQGFAFIDPNPNPKNADGTPNTEAEALPEGQPDLPTANIGRGTPIGSVIEQIMATCEGAQMLARDSGGDGRTADESPDSLNEKRFRETVTWQVIPEVRMNKTGEWKYDFFTNRYGRNIIWHVYPRIDQEPILSQRQIRDAYKVDDGLGVQKSTLVALAARGFLPKRYDYLFTGLNTEVLNFDLAFNFAWSVALPRFTGYYNDQAQQHARVNPLLLASQVDENYDQERLAWEGRRNAFNKNRAKEIENGQDQTEADLAEKKQLEAERTAVESIGARRDKTYQDAIAERNRVVSSIAIADKNRVLNGDLEQDPTREFVERVLDEQRDQNKTPSRIPLIPFSFIAGDQPRQDAGLGGTGQWHNGRQLFGAVLNQVYGVMSDRFQQIELQVRGDPFWIGSGCFEASIQHQNEAAVDRQRQAYHMLGQNCFMFRFKYPTNVSDSGTIELKDNETVTGVYKVTQVKSVFQGGSFSHTLSAVRLPLIDLFASVLGIENSQSEEDAATEQAKPDDGLLPAEELAERQIKAAEAAAKLEKDRRESAEKARLLRDSRNPAPRGG